MSEQSGKSRALRISLDYHKHRGRLYWLRWGCALIALLFSGAYGIFVLAGVFASRGGSISGRSNWLDYAVLQLNTGPVARVHEHFEADCQLCHVTNQMRPIASDAMRLGGEKVGAELADKCQSCHSVQSHVAHVTDPACRRMDQSCASCHQDHLGRNVDLARVASSKCIQCHANLIAACGAETALRVKPTIADFSLTSHSTDAKTFRSLESDPGRIRFSHAQHLNLGQVKTGRLGGFRQDMLTQRWQARYRTGPGNLVQLGCDDCHKLQAASGPVALSDFAKAESAMDSELAHFYAPIDFEQHCVGCHQLTFTGQTAGMLPLPHGATREEFARVLAARLVGGRISGKIAMPKDRVVGPQEQQAAMQELADADIDTAVERAYAGCLKCHFAEDVLEQNLRKTDASAMLPPRWLRRGTFDHAAHEKISNCSFCHRPTDSEDASRHTEVMIEGPASCIPCHRDAQQPQLAADLNGEPLPDLRDPENRERLLGSASQPDLASNECTLCHRYHWSRPHSLSAATEPAARGATP